MKLAIIGGHLSPALAVLDALPKNIQVLFIGRKHTFEGDKAYSLEYNTIKSLKIPFVEIYTGRLQRKFTRYTIPSLLKIPYGFVQSFFILHKFKPDVVLGFGGYLSLPVILSAYILRIPIVIHEQTLEAGVANRILSIFAKKVCISWESSFKYFPRSKTVLTGNPNRHSGNQASPEHPESPDAKRDAGQASMTALYDMSKKIPIIYITGGSSGSHFINNLVGACIKELLKQFVVIHQTGDSKEYRDFDRLQSLRNSLSQELKSRYILKKFIEPEDVGLLLQKANLIVSRSGINTITELIYFEKPALLIPHPYSQGKEQLKNALFLKSLGLGEVLEQDSSSSQLFLQKIEEMVNNIDKYKSDSGKIGMTNFENAAKKIIEVVKYVQKKKKGKAVS